MSTYQYYEFQAIDRPLNELEQQAVSALSSRVDMTPTRASFVYHYSDFRGNPLDILARYYDAFYYIANWGTTRLAFRLPRDMVDVALIRQYKADEFLMVHEHDKHIIVEFEIRDEDGYGWTEGEGSLAGFIALRDALLNQDYRVLYLGWLRGVASGWLDEELEEPPVPDGLGKLNGTLQAFVGEFGVDKHLIAVAAEASEESAENQPSWSQAVATLSAADKQAWLMRLAEGELLLTHRFRRKLQQQLPNNAATTHKPRTVTDLLARSEEIKAEAERIAIERAEAAARIAIERAEAARIQRLKEFAPKAARSWIQAELLIQRKNAKAYDEAVRLLQKLKELAIYQNKEAAFQERLEKLRKRHFRLRSLQGRLRKLATT